MLQLHPPEREWQRLFTDCPYILSESLPLRLDPEDLIPTGTPGTSTADFLFYPQASAHPFFYGAIELKRTTSTILSLPRKHIVTLSADARTAIAQAEKFSKELGRKLVDRLGNLVLLGNDRHVFVVMGMSAELQSKLTTDKMHEQFLDQLPRGCRLLPYDVLYSSFSRKVPAQVHLLHPGWVVPDVLSTGLKDLDRLLGGLKRGELYFIAGGPSSGKSSLLMRLTEAVGVEQNGQVLYASLESPSTETAQQLVYMRGRVDGNDVRSGRIAKAEFKRIVRRGYERQGQSIRFYEHSRPTFEDLRFRLGAASKKAALDLVVIDSVQSFISGEGSYRDQVKGLSSEVAQIAKDFNVPIVASCRPGRRADRDTGRFTLPDLHVDVAPAQAVILLHREGIGTPKANEWGVCEAEVAINRGGRTGTAYLAYLPQYCRLENLAIDIT